MAMPAKAKQCIKNANPNCTVYIEIIFLTMNVVFQTLIDLNKLFKGQTSFHLVTVGSRYDYKLFSFGHVRSKGSIGTTCDTPPIHGILKIDCVIVLYFSSFHSL